ncbi:hypothetical protein APY03_2210 [Variovorax sp. WDL1]|nr:hypothetical protein APY03_2210 [Variovorax sp. WDL1]
MRSGRDCLQDVHLFARPMPMRVRSSDGIGTRGLHLGKEASARVRGQNMPRAA